jgi:hypothetical protein
MTPDALAILDDVEVGKFHEYRPHLRVMAARTVTPPGTLSQRPTRRG